MAFWKESMINRLPNLINRNRSAAKISQVLCSNVYTIQYTKYENLENSSNFKTSAFWKK